MKKSALSRLLTFGLLGFSTFSGLGWISSCVPTHPVDDSVAWSSPTLPSVLIWPAQGTISQGFHTFHEGIDIAGPTGTPVVAAAAGEVVSAGWDDWGLGNAIVLQHSDDSRTVYGHNSRLLVRKGDQVSQGQAIAQTGSTGNSTGPHLHFEVHPGGSQAVDPTALLPSLVAGKIPPAQAIAVAPELASPARTSPRPVTTQGGCNGEAVIEGETANFRVKICRENDQLVYVGQPKQNPSAAVRLPAWSTGEGRYRANNGSYSYDINAERVVVLQNGRQIRSESLSHQSSYVSRNPELIIPTRVPSKSAVPEPLNFDIAPVSTTALPRASAPATSSLTTSQCDGEAVVEGETANFRVKICRENGQLVYVGQPKHNPNAAVRLPAWSMGEGRYRADNGSYSYNVSAERVVVLQNGRQIRSERFYR